jgi:hypothetical protein
VQRAGIDAPSAQELVDEGPFELGQRVSEAGVI